jgi:hypothetical protein
MLQFPKSTVFDKRIPKTKFYKHLKLDTRLEKKFVDEIESIHWMYKLSPETLPIKKGETVAEIEVFEIFLKNPSISKQVLEFIDREIPYHLVFILRYDYVAKIGMAYKEPSKNRLGKFTIDTYYQTEWQEYEELNLDIKGVTLDKVYENFLEQVSEGSILLQSSEDIKEAVERSKKFKELEKSIQRIERKIHTEKQFNLQVELMEHLRKLKAELRDL